MLTLSMGKLTALICVIWMALDTAATSTAIITASTSDHTSILYKSCANVTAVSQHYSPVQSRAPSPSVTAISPTIKTATNVQLIAQCFTVASVSRSAVIIAPSVSTIYITSTTTTTIDSLCTTSATDYDTSESETMACSIKQAEVVGGIIGGAMLGSSLTVIVTTVAAILIAKYHKKRSRGHQSRYFCTIIILSLCICL